MKKITIISILITALILSACTDNAGGILYEIENEEPIDDGSLNNEISISSLVSDGSFFYIAAGKVYRKPYSGGSWVATARPGGSDSYAGKVAYSGSTLIALITKGNSSTGLYTSGDNGDSWTEAAVDTFSATQSAIDLLTTDGEVFIISGDSNTGYSDIPFIYSVYQITGIGSLDTISCTELTFTTPYNGMNKVIDIAIDGSSTVWAITAAGVITSAASTGTGLPTSIFYTGIHYSTLADHTGLYVAAGGSVYTFDGLAWTEEQDDLGSTKDFSDIRVYDSGETPIEALTLGKSSGYYENVGAGGTFQNPEITANSNYKNYDISDAPVFRLVSIDTGLGTTPFVTYALTATTGLWINKALSWELE